jgi:hypothetical protein
MIDHGLNYHQSAATTLGLDSLLAIDGDGVDSDGDGKPDAKINPNRIKNRFPREGLPGAKI